jgi:hypothetical protein
MTATAALDGVRAQVQRVGPVAYDNTLVVRPVRAVLHPSANPNGSPPSLGCVVVYQPGRGA